ncbi:plastid transcriptionally active 2 [Actinidia rufa]|uniref:Plastid transcriptionally active 2 n=1 Tax=Actinidia rufa TaxID=165716 RepID=A0A7J0DBP6_9ERIC|nr:plastid transcriptionally active 2 [Actinidia rufa]
MTLPAHIPPTLPPKHLQPTCAAANSIAGCLALRAVSSTSPLLKELRARSASSRTATKIVQPTTHLHRLLSASQPAREVLRVRVVAKCLATRARALSYTCRTPSRKNTSLVDAEGEEEKEFAERLTYNTCQCCARACARRGLGDEAEMLFTTMNEGSVLPDVSTYSCLVETFGKLGRLEKVSELMRGMETRGNLPEISSYNVLLEAYAHSGLIKEAMGCLSRCREAGCTPNARGCSIILIQVFGEGGYFKEVVTLFHDLVEENVDPNMEIYEGLIFACGKGGFHEDAKKILCRMNENRLVPSSKVYSGVIEACGQAAFYEEALVAFNTMNEVGSMPTIETFNSLIHTFARGGLYKGCEAIFWRMDEYGIVRNSDSFNGIVEGFRQGGQFEGTIKAYVEMEKARCDPDERTLEAVLSVYCFAGLVDESEEQFGEIKHWAYCPVSCATV